MVEGLCDRLSCFRFLRVREQVFPPDRRATALVTELIPKWQAAVDLPGIEAWASLKSVRAKGWRRRAAVGGAQRRTQFPRRNARQRHGSSTDPEAKLYRKSK